jgi:hypothetical protein
VENAASVLLVTAIIVGRERLEPRRGRRSDRPGRRTRLAQIRATRPADLDHGYAFANGPISPGALTRSASAWKFSTTR